MKRTKKKKWKNILPPQSKSYMQIQWCHHKKKEKRNQKAILELKNKHPQIKHLDKCNGEW